MKKTGTETKIIVDITSAKNINDVYATFAIAKFNKLNEVEKDLLRKIIVGNYFNELYDYCDSIDCENCEIEGIDGTIRNLIFSNEYGINSSRGIKLDKSRTLTWRV